MNFMVHAKGGWVGLGNSELDPHQERVVLSAERGAWQVHLLSPAHTFVNTPSLREESPGQVGLEHGRM